MDEDAGGHSPEVYLKQRSFPSPDELIASSRNLSRRDPTFAELWRQGREPIVGALVWGCRDRYLAAAALLRQQSEFCDSLRACASFSGERFDDLFAALAGWYWQLRRGDILQQRFGEDGAAHRRRIVQDWIEYGRATARNLVREDDVVRLVLEAIVDGDAARAARVRVLLTETVVERVQAYDASEWRQIGPLDEG